MTEKHTPYEQQPKETRNTCTDNRQHGLFKKLLKEREQHYVFVKGPINQDDITTINIKMYTLLVGYKMVYNSCEKQFGGSWCSKTS